MFSLARTRSSWQIILADLALILFLVTAAALSASLGIEPARTLDRSTANPAFDPAAEAAAQAPAQALYRAGPGLPTLAQWLEAQPRDPRAALTIVAEHAPDDEQAAWSDARSMAATARALGLRSRVIIREAEASAVYASLAYDQPNT